MFRFFGDSVYILIELNILVRIKKRLLLQKLILSSSVYVTGLTAVVISAKTSFLHVTRLQITRSRLKDGLPYLVQEKLFNKCL